MPTARLSRRPVSCHRETHIHNLNAGKGIFFQYNHMNHLKCFGASPSLCQKSYLTLNSITYYCMYLVDRWTSTTKTHSTCHTGAAAYEKVLALLFRAYLPDLPELAVPGPFN